MATTRYSSVGKRASVHPTRPPPVRGNEVRYWKIAPGENADNWEQCRQEGIITMGWGRLGDVPSMDEAKFQRAQRAKMGIRTKFKQQGCYQVWTFANEINPGDRIVANHGFYRALGIGTVTGPCRYEPDYYYSYVIPVRWDDTHARKIEEKGWQKALVKLRREKFEEILRAPLVGGPHEQREEVHVKDNQLNDDRLWKLLLARKNVVFYGPPGTGKTRESLLLAARWRKEHGDASVWSVTFHPSFAYEDFIEGFRPDENGRFQLRSGIFVKTCDAARNSPDRKFLLLVDEINRGDVARIFGELITLIEPDKRVPADP